MTPEEWTRLEAMVASHSPAPAWVSWAKGLAAAVVVAGALLAAAGVLFVTRTDADAAHTTILKDHDADIAPIVQTMHEVATDSKLLGQRLGQTEERVRELREAFDRRRRPAPEPDPGSGP
jgi:septal ring factor EnvC (AmiA/AmiB activator)